MRLPVLPLLAALIASSGGSLALASDTDSDIRNVTVYLNGGASVTRIIRVDLPSGRSNVTLGALPASTDPASLSISADRAASPDALRTRQVPSGEIVSPKEAKLARTLKAARIELENRAARANVLRARRDFLLGIGKGDTMDRAAMEYAWDLLNAQGESTSLAVAEQDRKVQAQQREVTRLEKELSSIRAGQREHLMASTSLTAITPGPHTITLTYFVRGPRWQPTYTAQLDTQSGEIELIRAGNITQNTGEDWTDVALTLSTAAPRQQPSAPNLHTWWIGGASSPRPMALKAQHTRIPAADTAFAAEEALAPPPATLNATAFTSEFVVSGRTTIESDNAQHEVSLDTHGLDADLNVRVHPHRDPTAYLSAAITLPAQTHFLPGPVTLIRDGMLVGRDHWRPRAENAPLLAGFGQDRRVKVNRGLLADETGEQGLFSKKGELIRRYAITITSQHDRTVPVEVIEQLPVSRSKEVKVSVVNVTSDGYERSDDPVPGTVRWTFDLPAGQTRELSFAYKVSFPPGSPPPGL